jgi:hypothetical protein
MSKNKRQGKNECSFYIKQQHDVKKSKKCTGHDVQVQHDLELDQSIHLAD